MIRTLALVVVVMSACAGPAQERIDVVKRTTQKARERGAYRCAPEALARAESRLEFAQIELRGGELIGAESQLDLAEVAATFALQHAASCIDNPPPIETPTPVPDAAEPLDLSPPPPADRDGDGIADADDKCPDQAGVPEQSGCPAPKLIVVRDDKIELKQKVHFQTGKATILPDSNPLLNEIADALRRREVRVRIEGHTDSRGSAALNTKLSRARADAVRAWLIAAGIDGARLDSVGYGPTQPIADNRTASGREENRRVEFFLLTPGK